MKLSGAIGLSILKKYDKEYNIFYDQHNNENYCNPPNIYLDSYINKLFNDNILILLEELLDYGEEGEIITLWKETPHTVRFKDFFLKNKNYSNIVPFDIRTILFPCSIFLILQVFEKSTFEIYEDVNLKELKKNLKKLTVREYFYPLFYFFDIIKKEEYLHKKYRHIIKNIKNIKKKIIKCFKKVALQDKQTGKIIYKHYKNLKKKTKYFRKKYVDDYLNYTIEDFYILNNKNRVIHNHIYKNFLQEDNIEDYSWIDYIELLADSIMEYYGILIILCNNKKTTYLHAGLAHSSNIVWLLRNMYNFESVKDIGFTERDMDIIQDINKIPIVKNCIAL